MVTVFLNNSGGGGSFEFGCLEFEKKIVRFCFGACGSDVYTDTMLGYANSICTVDGGTRIDAVKASLTRTLNNLGKKLKKFKTRLGNQEVRKVVDQSVQEYLTEYLELHPDVLNSILSKSLNALKAALEAKRARELVKSKSVLKSSSLPGKLADCSATNPKEAGCLG